MSKREAMNAENARALRLVALLMLFGTGPGGGCSLSVIVSLNRNDEGRSLYSVKLGPIKASAPTLGAALLGALDLAGMN